jgi:hypothetical protein
VVQGGGRPRGDHEAAPLLADRPASGVAAAVRGRRRRAA